MATGGTGRPERWLTADERAFVVASMEIDRGRRAILVAALSPRVRDDRAALVYGVIVRYRRLRSVRAIPPSTVPPSPPDPLAGLRSAFAELLAARDVCSGGDHDDDALEAARGRLATAWTRWDREQAALRARMERADALAAAVRAVKDHLDRPPTAGGIGWTMAQVTLEDDAWAALAAYEMCGAADG